MSGPLRPRRAATQAARTAVARAPVAVRLGHAAMRVGDARLLDRLVRGRAWIALLAVGLMGIVFTQVSLLRLNAGISRAVTAADTLDRQNSSLRADISRLDSDERIQGVAARLGMVLPPAGDVHYLDAREASGRRAAAAIKAPNQLAPAVAQAAVTGVAAPTATAAPGAATAAPTTTTTTATAAQAAAPATNAATPAPATSPAQTTASAQTTAPAETAAPASGAPTAALGATTAAGGSAAGASAGAAPAPQGQG